MKRIGLLGGSFDPVHLAHVALAQSALSALALEQVQLIPTANPWQREALQATPAQRLDMLALAIADQPGLAVNPIEIERGGATYTIDTLRALPGDARYVWLLGADQLANFCTWRAWDEIAERVDMAVAVRPHAAGAARRTGGAPAGAGSRAAIPALRAHGRVRLGNPPPPGQGRIHGGHAGRARGRVYCGAQSLPIILPPAGRDRREYRFRPSARGLLFAAMDIQKLQRAVIDALEDVKAQDIKVFNTTHLTSLFDRVVIASATSNRQTRALASSVADRGRAMDLSGITIEGEDTGEWVVVDLGDVVVHIMQPAIRQYYNLEEIWGGKPVRVKLLPESTRAAPVAGSNAYDGVDD